MVMIYMEFVIFSLFALHLDYCNIQRVYGQLGRNSHCLHIHKLYYSHSGWGVQHYVIKFVSDLVFSTNKTEILLKVTLNTKNPPPSNKQTKTHVKYFDRIKLVISVVIGTDCIGSCKSNYHMNPTTTAPISHGDAFYNIKRNSWHCT
jgi:hypothetical protein